MTWSENMNYFSEMRVQWIKEQIHMYGYINRWMVEKRFNISSSQASLDIRYVREHWPDLLIYDKHLARYVRKEDVHLDKRSARKYSGTR